ncbi:MAG: hypothetical protein CMG69_02565 [Candidatus Marinimicrobia bacterium]|nr:hypothetical protein [Candidatus Neomarinimicrobiota bacterium]
MKKNYKSNLSIFPFKKNIVSLLLIMKLFSIQICLILLSGNFTFGQFKEDADALNSFPILNIGNSVSPSLFSPNRLQMNHGFNFSINSFNGKAYNTNSYTNTLSFILKPNLLLQSNFTLFQVPGNLVQQSEIGYDLSLTYKPTQNSIFQFSIQKYPFPYRHNSNSNILRYYN